MSFSIRAHGATKALALAALAAAVEKDTYAPHDGRIERGVAELAAASGEDPAAGRVWQASAHGHIEPEGSVGISSCSVSWTETTPVA